MLLIIKGDANCARDAAIRHGLESAEFVSESVSKLGRPQPFTTLRVAESEWKTVSDWYGEPSELEDGVGYPNGTMLWFKYEENANA